MSFAEDLQRHRQERVQALNTEWALSYDPYNYFSVLKPRYIINHICSKVFLYPFLLVMAFSIVWVTVVQTLMAGCQHPPCNSFLTDLSPFSSFLSLFQLTLALILSFRLARCAVRYYDARTAAGSMILTCRTMASEINVYFSHDTELRDTCLRWLAAYPVAVKNSLRGSPGPREELAGILNEKQVTAVLASRHPPLLVFDVLRFYVTEGSATSPLPPAVAAMAFQGLTVSINTLNAAMGAMERIGNTPLPLAFETFLRGYVLLYLFLVVFLLGPTWGWYALPIMAALSWLMLGLEAAATECERPVLSHGNHLPLERYCVVIMDNIFQILTSRETVVPPSATGCRPATPFKSTHPAPGVSGYDTPSPSFCDPSQYFSGPSQSSAVQTSLEQTSAR